jgi:hypothetical protein
MRATTAAPRFLVASGDCDLGAFPGEQQRRGFADAGGPARDESNFVF